jgi:microcystin-dependent protein
MKRLVALMMCVVSFGAAAQVTYPYNPDEDGNGQIAVGDLQGILANYGNAFSPSEILVDGETLTTVLTQLQNSIDSLSALTGGSGSVLDMPLGTVLPIATESVPEGWMLCDGREISIEEYHDLYDLIGTTYGAGDSAFWAQVFYPATTFNIPDLRGRTIIGANDMGGELSSVLQAHQASFGQLGGEELHLLTELELPAHTHDVEYFRRTTGGYSGDPWHGAADNYATNGAPQWVKPTGVRASGGGGDQPHNNMQPYMALNYMMKVQAEEDFLESINIRLDSLEQQLFSSESVFEFQGFSASTSPSAGWSTVDERLLEVPTMGAFDVELTLNGGGGGSWLPMTWGIEVSFMEVGSDELIDAALILSNSSFEASTPGIVTFVSGFSGDALSKYSRLSFDGLDLDEILMVTRMGKWQDAGYNYAGWPASFNRSADVGVHIVPK